MITETMMLDQPEIPDDLIVGQQTFEDMQEEIDMLGISYLNLTFQFSLLF